MVYGHNDKVRESMKTTIIGISGGSGSGKSVIIKQLKDKFKAGKVAFISQDNYYKPRHTQKKDLNGVHNFDLPSSVDLEAFTNDVIKLKAGQEIIRQEYTFNNPKVSPGMIEIIPAPVIVVEGLFIFCHEPIWDLLDLRVFIHASDSQRLSRRILRDQMERNYPLEDVIYRYEHHVYPAFKAYIEPYYNQSDLIINNFSNYHTGLEVLEAYIRHLIAK